MGLARYSSDGHRGISSEKIGGLYRDQIRKPTQDSQRRSALAANCNLVVSSYATCRVLHKFRVINRNLPTMTNAYF